MTAVRLDQAWHTQSDETRIGYGRGQGSFTIPLAHEGDMPVETGLGTTSWTLLMRTRRLLGSVDYSWEKKRYDDRPHTSRD